MSDVSSATEAAPQEDEPVAFYLPSDGGYRAQRPSMSPWDDRFQSGVAVSGLLAHMLETMAVPDGLDIARFHVDIFKTIRIDTPMVGDIRVLREGRRIHVAEASLMSDGALAARASVLRLARSESPVLDPPIPAEDPETLSDLPPLNSRSATKGALTTRRIAGGLMKLGPGTLWARFDKDLVAGTPMTPFVAAAMASDLGSAVSSVLDWRHFTYANVDISMNLMRPPQGPWIKVDAVTRTQGEGRALVNTELSDTRGLFGYAHQTLFVDPR